MVGPWSRLIVVLIFLYLATNVCFAGLYLLEPASINNAHPKSFADAFFSSVQKFSTIGNLVLRRRARRRPPGRRARNGPHVCEGDAPPVERTLQPRRRRHAARRSSD